MVIVNDLAKSIVDRSPRLTHHGILLLWRHVWILAHLVRRHVCIDAKFLPWHKPLHDRRRYGLHKAREELCRAARYTVPRHVVEEPFVGDRIPIASTPSRVV